MSLNARVGFYYNLYFGKRIDGLWKFSRRLSSRNSFQLSSLIRGLPESDFVPHDYPIENPGFSKSTIRDIIRFAQRLGKIHPEIKNSVEDAAKTFLSIKEKELGDFYISPKGAAIINERLETSLRFFEKHGFDNLVGMTKELIAKAKKIADRDTPSWKEQDFVDQWTLNMMLNANLFGLVWPSFDNIRLLISEGHAFSSAELIAILTKLSESRHYNKLKNAANSEEASPSNPLIVKLSRMKGLPQNIDVTIESPTYPYGFDWFAIAELMSDPKKQAAQLV